VRRVRLPLKGPVSAVLGPDGDELHVEVRHPLELSISRDDGQAAIQRGGRDQGVDVAGEAGASRPP